MKIVYWNNTPTIAPITIGEAVEVILTTYGADGSVEAAREIAENCAKAIAKLVALLPEEQQKRFVEYPFRIED